MKKIILYSLALMLCTASCKKEKTAEDQLPPITHTGANTFGCLVNGKVFIPKGYSGTGTPNPKAVYDIGLNGLPYLQIDNRQFNSQNNQVGSFVITIDSLIGLGRHLIYTNKKQIGYGSTIVDNCGILPSDDYTYKNGFVNINKYDLVNGIISGEFNLKIKPSNCDSLFITNGRFDIKL